MRVKIRGLVFVGFAAAVFAQSAMADATTDAKTVTSKLYVDSKVDGVTETGSGNNITYGDTTITQNSPNDKAPSALNVYKFVTSQVAGSAVTIQGDSTYTTASSNGSGTWTVGIDATKLGTTANITSNTNTEGLTTVGAVRGLLDTSLSDAASGSDAENDTTVPTSAAVVSYAEKKGNKLDGDNNNTIAQFYNSPTKYPSAKAVYDFVKAEEGSFQPKVERTGPSVGIRNGSGTSESPYIYTWGGIQAQGGNTLGGTTDNYVTMTESGGVYSIGLATTMVSVDKADITSNNKKLMTAMGVNDYMTDLVWTATDGTIASAYDIDTKVPTVKNVYDFVTGAISAAGDGYQPKIDDAKAGKIMIGYNTQTGEGSGATYNSDWRELVGDYTLSGSTYAGGYIQVAPNPENASQADVRLLNVGHAGSYISSATQQDATNSMDALVSAYAVKEYVTGLTGGLTIPSMPDTCTTAATNGGYCALVYGDTDDTQSGVQAGLMWTVMAPVPTNPSNP